MRFGPWGKSVVVTVAWAFGAAAVMTGLWFLFTQLDRPAVAVGIDCFFPPAVGAAVWLGLRRSHADLPIAAGLGTWALGSVVWFSNAPFPTGPVPWASSLVVVAAVVRCLQWLFPTVRRRTAREPRRFAIVACVVLAIGASGLAAWFSASLVYMIRDDITQSREYFLRSGADEVATMCGASMSAGCAQAAAAVVESPVAWIEAVAGFSQTRMVAARNDEKAIAVQSWLIDDDRSAITLQLRSESGGDQWDPRNANTTIGGLPAHLNVIDEPQVSSRPLGADLTWSRDGTTYSLSIGSAAILESVPDPVEFLRRLYTSIRYSPPAVEGGR